jgi:hypothetical protein
MQSLESTPSELADVPSLNGGIDLNPVFTSSTVFHPAMTGGEFASAGISLMYGWLINPTSPKHTTILHVRDYNTAMNLIVKADMLTCRLLVGADADQGGDNAVSSQAGLSHTNINLTEEERWKVKDSKYHVELPSTTQMSDVPLPSPGLSSDPHKLPISSQPVVVVKKFYLCHSTAVQAGSSFHSYNCAKSYIYLQQLLWKGLYLFTVVAVYQDTSIYSSCYLSRYICLQQLLCGRLYIFTAVAIG